MKKGVCLVFVLLLFAMPFTSSAGYNVVSDKESLSVGDNVIFQVQVSDVENLYAFGFDVSYGSDLKLISSEQGSFLSSDGGLTFTTPNKKEENYLRDFAVTRYATKSGVSGSGVLANLEFEALESGKPEITLLNVRFFDEDVNEISLNEVSGSSVSGGFGEEFPENEFVNDQPLPEDDSGLGFLPIILISLGILIVLSILVVLFFVVRRTRDLGSHNQAVVKSTIETTPVSKSNAVTKVSSSGKNDGINRASIVSKETESNKPVMESEKKKIIRELKRKGFSEEEIRRRLN